MITTTMRVAILGATGQTGSIIVDGLLKSIEPRYEVTALIRPSSLQKPAVRDLEKKGVNIVTADLSGPENELVKALNGQEVVISTIYGPHVLDEIPLINASKAAGVRRYLPCFFATVAPPKGALVLRDMKEDVLNHIKKLYLPYTAVDVGWWYQVNLPRLPSGRIDYAVMNTADSIIGDGNQPLALTDLQDVGTYVARIINDGRTLNRLVLAYNEELTFHQIFDILEKLSGESIKRNYVSQQSLQAGLSELRAKTPSLDSLDFVTLSQYEYWNSCAIDGDNTAEHARYLGYITSKELYPDFSGRSFEAFVQEALDGKGKRVYEHLQHLDGKQPVSTEL